MMTCTRKFAVPVVMCLLLAAGSSQARADEASKRVKIKEMFAIIHLQDTINQMSNPERMRSMVQAIAPGIAKQTPEEQKNLDDLMVRVSQFLRETLDWQTMEPQYVDLYATTYTEEDIDGLLVFYRSPTGQAMVAKQPEILAKSQAIAQTRMQAAMPKLMQLILQASAAQQQKSSSPPQP